MQKLTLTKCLILGLFLLAPASNLTAADPNLEEEERENILGKRDLEGIVQQQNLDSYWMSERMWHEYGYRSHVNMQKTKWPGKLPAGMKNYYYGPSWQIKDKLDLGDPEAKFKVQWGKDGTWH